MPQFMLASQFNRPTISKRIISLSPLARVFQPYKSIEPYLDDPLAWKNDKTPFDIVLEASWATRVLESGKIHLLDESITNVVVGIDNTRFRQEYDSTGLVYFDVSEEMHAALEYTHKTKRDLPPDLKKELDQEVDKYRELSHQRVLSHCKRLYNTLVAARQQVREAGKEPPMPNDMELLIAFILKDEVEKQKNRREKLQKMWEQSGDKLTSDVKSMF